MVYSRYFLSTEISTINCVSGLSAQLARTTKWLPPIGFETGMEMTSKCSSNLNIPQVEDARGMEGKARRKWKLVSQSIS